MFYGASLGLADVPGTLTGNCGDDPGIACRLAWDLSHSTTATQVVKVYLAGPDEVAYCSAAHILYACTGSTLVSLVNTVNSTAG